MLCLCYAMLCSWRRACAFEPHRHAQARNLHRLLLACLLACYVNPPTQSRSLPGPPGVRKLEDLSLASPARKHKDLALLDVERVGPALIYGTVVPGTDPMLCLCYALSVGTSLVFTCFTGRKPQYGTVAQGTDPMLCYAYAMLCYAMFMASSV